MNQNYGVAGGAGGRARDDGEEGQEGRYSDSSSSVDSELERIESFPLMDLLLEETGKFLPRGIVNRYFAPEGYELPFDLRGKEVLMMSGKNDGKNDGENDGGVGKNVLIPDAGSDPRFSTVSVEERL